MDKRGAVETAATFRALMEEECRHVDAVASVSAALTGHVPDTAPFVWRLPPEIAASWEELAGRTDLTPYRALSLAVLNEERAFAFYSYIVSAATDPAVRRAGPGAGAGGTEPRRRNSPPAPESLEEIAGRRRECRGACRGSSRLDVSDRRHGR